MSKTLAIVGELNYDLGPKPGVVTCEEYVCQNNNENLMAVIKRQQDQLTLSYIGLAVSVVFLLLAVVALLAKIRKNDSGQPNPSFQTQSGTPSSGSASGSSDSLPYTPLR